MEIPTDWQVSEVSHTLQRVVWLVQQPLQPSFEDWNCQQQAQHAWGQWCDSAGSRWLLQQLDGRYWLTQTRADVSSQVEATESWLGHLVQEVTNESQRLRIYQTRHHPKQLLNFMRMRHTKRSAQLVRLSASQFYLQLRHPLEWIFLHRSEHGYIALQYQAARASDL